MQELTVTLDFLTACSILWRVQDVTYSDLSCMFRSEVQQKQNRIDEVEEALKREIDERAEAARASVQEREEHAQAIARARDEASARHEKERSSLKTHAAQLQQVGRALAFHIRAL